MSAAPAFPIRPIRRTCAISPSACWPMRATMSEADPDTEAVPRYVVAGRMAGREGPAGAVEDHRCAGLSRRSAKGFLLAGGSCRVDKVDDAKVIAVVRQSSEREYLTDVAWARRLDLKSGKFSVVDPARVDCVNEGYGEP